jgi:hypothetical protein
MRLDRSKFRSWLKTKPAAEIVGHNRDCISCPIAKFYHETSGGSEIVIFDSPFGDHTIDRGYSKRPLPWWAECFVATIDGDVNGKISAGRALDVLEHI